MEIEPTTNRFYSHTLYPDRNDPINNYPSELAQELGLLLVCEVQELITWIGEALANSIIPSCPLIFVLPTSALSILLCIILSLTWFCFTFGMLNVLAKFSDVYVYMYVCGFSPLSRECYFLFLLLLKPE